MTTFATVGIERIQSVLSRSRHLWGRRGASEELVQLTTLPGKATELGIPTVKLAVQRALDLHAESKVEITPEALDLDGVINFVSESEVHALKVARYLAAQIRKTLPSTQVCVSWVTIPNGTYYDALAAYSPGDAYEWTPETYFPAANEVPFVRTCDECGQSPASEESENKNTDPGQPKSVRLCRDCYVRSNSNLEWVHDRRIKNVSGKRPRSNPSRFAAEHWLLDEINARLLHSILDNSSDAKSKANGSPTAATSTPRPLVGVKDFNELAAMVRPRAEGQRRRTHTDNHTALFFADGNGLGALFQKAQKQAVKNRDMGEYKALSQAIKDATTRALVEATDTILFDDDTTLPAIPHILGGDDLLVTLPADRAWEFITKFLDVMEEELNRLDLLPETKRPTVSAGVLFCKAEYPFGDQVEMAESLLRKAKRHVNGADWSVAWSDITSDGLHGNHTPWTLQELRDRTKALDYTRSDLPASAEAELLAAIQHPDIRIAQQKLNHRIARIEGAGKFFETCGIDHKNLTSVDVRLVNDITVMGRWWR